MRELRVPGFEEYADLRESGFMINRASGYKHTEVGEA